MSNVHPYFEAILRAQKRAIVGRRCAFCCERPATQVDVFFDPICDECYAEERRQMKEAEARAESLYFSGETTTGPHGGV